MAEFCVSAEGTSPEPQEIKQLVLQLGDNDFVTREKAEKTIKALGSKSRAILMKIYKQTDDPEIKLRLKKVLLLLERLIEINLNANDQSSIQGKPLTPSRLEEVWAPDRSTKSDLVLYRSSRVVIQPHSKSSFSGL